MICNAQIKTASGQENAPQPMLIINKIIEFLDVYIDKFPAFLVSSNIHITNEKCINTDLLVFMNNNVADFFEIDNFHFSFIKDDCQKGSNYEPDLGVCLANKKCRKETFFHIECKRLPARKGHEKEYVQGKLGGIQRFKENKHGGKFEYSAMIAYIEENSKQFWFDSINNWISELISLTPENWTNQEYLYQIKPENYSRFQSNHARKGNNNITLNHFWIKLTWNSESQLIYITRQYLLIRAKYFKKNLKKSVWVKEFALRSGKPEKTIHKILNGNSSITSDMAVKFESVLNIPAKYGLNFQTKYDESVSWEANYC